MESRYLSGIHLFLVLITISMNLSDQLVIVISNPDLKAPPSRKNLLLGSLIVII